MAYKIFFHIFANMEQADLAQLKKIVANKLYKARCEANLSQVQLENEGIISQSHLSKIENGDLNVSAVLLYILAKRYNKEYSYFFEKWVAIEWKAGSTQNCLATKNEELVNQYLPEQMQFHHIYNKIKAISN